MNNRPLQFQTLPSFGGDQRQVAEVVRGIMDGRTNNAGKVTLATGNATTTTLYDDRIGYNSLIFLVPISAAAYTDSMPYGAFQSLVDQSITANTATAMTLDTTDYSLGIYLSNSSRMNVRNTGVYNLQWSGQFQNTDNTLHDVSVWIRKNGSNVTGSTGFISVPNSHGGVDGHIVVGWNYFLELSANDYVELYWSATNAAVSLQFYGTQTSPTRPSTASLIATLNYISPNASTNVYVSNQTKGSAVLNHWANGTADKTYGYIIVG
jgi:hypothetical protein